MQMKLQKPLVKGETVEEKTPQELHHERVRQQEAAKFYRPMGAIHELWKCRSPEILLDGPAGTGKTRGILEKLNLAAMKYPKMRGLLLRKTRVSMTQSVLVTFEDKVLPENSPILEGPSRAVRQSYIYPNGSELVVGGLDNADRIMSTEYDMIAVFEATEISEDDWEKIQTRKRNNKMPYQQAIADCNPSGPAHWLIKRFKKGLMTRLASTHKDNPTVTAEYLRTLENLSGHRKDRLLYGKWSAAEGLVFPNMQNCFVTPLEEIPEGNLIGGIDFGWNDAFAALGGVEYENEDGESMIYVFYERYKRKCTTDQHAAALNIVFPSGLGAWYADPSRPESIADFRKRGLTIARAKNNILLGIDAVNARINSGRLLISNDCTALIEESESYIYDENDDGGEKPLDKNNHALDSLRYLVLSHDWKGIGYAKTYFEEDTQP